MLRFGQQFFVGIELENPALRRHFQRLVARPPKIVAPFAVLDAGAERTRDLYRAIRRAGVDDIDFIDDAGDAAQALLEKTLFVLDDHAQADAGRLLGPIARRRGQTEDGGTVSRRRLRRRPARLYSEGHRYIASAFVRVILRYRRTLSLSKGGRACRASIKLGHGSIPHHDKTIRNKSLQKLKGPAEASPLVSVLSSGLTEQAEN